MDFKGYQDRAAGTDQTLVTRGGQPSAATLVPLLGLAGETGELLSEYKKHLRDGDAHRLFKARIAEELGDLLWYLANVATKFDLDLDAIAGSNLEKVESRWQKQQRAHEAFDIGFPSHEQLPRRFEVELADVTVDGRLKMRALLDGQPMGDHLTDNAYDSDGYRFHDVFHLAYAAVLGWSPVVRANLKRKRKSKSMVDEVEDGGRAAAIEEGLSAIIFDYAKDHNFLDGITALDSHILRTIKSVTSHLEVSVRSVGEWEKAVLQGYQVWRAVNQNGGGRMLIDLDARSITYLGPTSNSPKD